MMERVRNHLEIGSLRLNRLLNLPSILKYQAEGIVYKLTEGMPQSSTWDTLKKRLCQVFSPMATKMHAATWIHSCLQSANKTLLEHVQRFTDLVVHTTGTDPTPVTCQVTIVLFIRHLFNKEIRKHVAGTKTIQTLRHAMTLAQETEIKWKIMRD